jgi:catechol 2,3-dioxygenase-like lactoylglutathione lyase family enzyme
VARMTTRFAVVGLVVTDLARSLAFYRRLGLDVPAAADTEPHVELVLENGMRLTWDTGDVIRSFDPDYSTPSGGHRLNIAFGCDDAAEVDAVHDSLVAAGYESHHAPWDAFWGQRYAVVRDPDGNPVDLFAALGAG